MISLLEIAQNINEADDDKYVSIGYGRYKEKGKEDDDNADVYVKTDSGKYVKSSDQKSDDDGGKPEEPKGKSLGKGDFDRDSNKAGDDDADDMDRDARFAADAEVDGPSPEDDWDSESVMTAKLDGEEVGDIIGDEDHPNYKKALRYIMSFDPDDEKLISGPGGDYGGWKPKDETVTINGQKYRPIKESKESNSRVFKEIYDRTFRSLK
jgi:hypothetical protein